MEKQNKTSTKTGSPGLTDADRKHLENITIHAYESWNRGEQDPYVDRYSDDVVYMTPSKETIIGEDGIRQHTTAFSRFHVEFPPSEIFGTAYLAIVRGTYVIKDNEGNFLDKGKYLNVCQKLTDGKWVVTHDIHNSDMPVQET